MRFIFRTTLIAGLVLGFQLVLGFPWWTLAIAGGLGGLFIHGKGIGVFFSGLFGAGITWSALAYQIDQATESILTIRIASLLSLETFPTGIIIITGVVGGLLGAFGGLSGWSLRKAFGNQQTGRKKGYYKG